ncbi:hypothetical protein RhiirC2_546650 [Rhizophagus irregularis]|uniref:DUF659 domain-containing protein n=1 Tax=Rhizophagus irregularis TaxID=588596 RepID=A0A2N1N320_9GLOM|nr:hypothetical protein RhiirC2_546650 [Rhizophagus irregularis]
MGPHRAKSSTVNIDTRIKEYPGIFRKDAGIMFCIYCDKSVEWKYKSTITSHINGNKHISNKKTYEEKQQNTQQQTLQSSLHAADSKKAVIEDMVEAFLGADIPLQKIDQMLPFFKKYLREGGAIPKAPTLRQIYLPSVFEKHITSLKLLFDSMPISIIMDETLDSCARSVVNTIFVYRNSTKLVSVNFLERVNNSTIGQTLFYVLLNNNIPFNKPILFLSDSAAYMKKCYRDILKPVMPQLIHVPCCAHILNLIGCRAKKH